MSSLQDLCSDYVLIGNLNSVLVIQDTILHCVLLHSPCTCSDTRCLVNETSPFNWLSLDIRVCMLAMISVSVTILGEELLIVREAISKMFGMPHVCIPRMSTLNQCLVSSRRNVVSFDECLRKHLFCDFCWC